MKRTFILILPILLVVEPTLSQEGLSFSVQQVFIVDDPGDAPADSVPVFFPRTLRSAIQCANHTPAADEIRFAVSMIQPTSALPNITAPLAINGLVGTIKVVLDGSLIPSPGPGVGAFGLVLTPGVCSVRDVEFRNFPSGGVALQGNDNLIQRCDIHDNDGPGINLNNSSNNIIVSNKVYGQTGSGGFGISFLLGSNGNRVDSNLIGTADGVTRSPNSRDGIYIETRDNTFRYNVISGNDGSGMFLTGSGADTSKNNLIEFNMIGTNATGSASLANFQQGITMGRSAVDAIRSNTISGNDGPGISLGNTTRDASITQNRIGTNSSGTGAIANGAGISSSGARTMINDNIISGNVSIGVAVFGGSVTIKGNKIGTSHSGMQDVGNRTFGISISGGSNHKIGGNTASERNIISGNDSAGVEVRGLTTSGVVIEGNYIGVKVDAMSALPNGTDGVVLTQGTHHDTVKSNVISGNSRNGILVTPRFRQVPYENVVRSNWIGVSSVGSFAIPNENNGVEIRNARTTIVGGTGSSERNIISGNLRNGVYITGDTASVNKVLGNRIGTNAAGSVPLGNKQHGILILDADSNEVGGMVVGGSNLISANDSTGIAIIGGGSRHNKVFSNEIGTMYPNRTGILIRSASQNVVGDNAAGNIINGNFGNGVEVLGDSNMVQGNTLRENKANGVFVGSGVANTIRRNSIFRNDSLGIDLAPAGVTRNDSLDLDTGANGLQNFPIVDSARVVAGTTILHGRLRSKPLETYRLEFFSNDECDPTRYGEGKDFLLETQTTTADSGVGFFMVVLPIVVDTNRVVTMTATDSEGSTSEFSRCWPKFLKIVDHQNDPIAHKDFALYRVRHDPPQFTETLIDTFQTTAEGMILIANAQFEEGDSVKVSRRVHIQPSVKRTTDPPVIAYSIHLDNAVFDSAMFFMSYDKLDSSIIQRIKLGHTTVAYNLLVSIEWDAETQYIDSLRAGFRRVANYLYDVFDGQVRLDTIRIVDAKVLWPDRDLGVHANNMYWPATHASGITFHGGTMDLPRRHWKSKNQNRNLSAFEYPLNPGAQFHYRTIGHEFGHYIGFYDEYESLGGAPFVRCGMVPNYGFMDYNYGDLHLQSGTEMSWDEQYRDPTCQNTEHWLHRRTRGESCWKTFERLYEGIYDGIRVPVIQPGERSLVPGADYFNGPNDYAGPLDYDVGSLVVFPDAVVAPAASTRFVLVTDRARPGVPLAKVEVTQENRVAGYDVIQGESSDIGLMMILGYHVGTDALRATGGGLVIGGNQPVQDSFTWYSGTFQITNEDTTVLALYNINGAFPLICSSSLQAGNIHMELRRINPFSSPPVLEVAPEGGGTSAFSLTASDSSYTASIPDLLGPFGRMTVTAVDSSAIPFFFDLRYRRASINSTNREIIGAYGDAIVTLDSALTGIQAGMLTSTSYPVIRTGLPPEVSQVSRAHSLSVFPPTALSGFSSITLRYEPVDTTRPIRPQIFLWNHLTSRWGLMDGSIVDSVRSSVSVPITKAGVYAAFASEAVSNVGPHGSLVPDRFELFQNYPNPFNASTTIRFGLPRPSHVRLEIFNVLGQRVALLANEPKEAGYHSVEFETTNFASGVYFYTLKVGGHIETRKMMLLK